VFELTDDFSLLNRDRLVPPDQLFAIGSDGTRLRQLTHARGLFAEADGTISAENIGPIGHSPIVGQ
jgi:hypothetical protein